MESQTRFLVGDTATYDVDASRRVLRCATQAVDSGRGLLPEGRCCHDVACDDCRRCGLRDVVPDQSGRHARLLTP